jgi:hypothetical protein
VGSNISDLNNFTASQLYANATGFQDTTAVKNDFHILSTSLLATASTTGGIVGDPRWLKIVTGIQEQSLTDIKTYFSADGLHIESSENITSVQVFTFDGRMIRNQIVMSASALVDTPRSAIIVRIIQPHKVTVLKMIQSE